MIKQGTSLLYFHCSFLQQTTLIKEMGLCRESNFILKNQYEFKAFGANKLANEFATKGYKKTTLNDFFKYFKEQLQHRLSAVWSVVQQTIVAKSIDE